MEDPAAITHLRDRLAGLDAPERRRFAKRLRGAERIADQERRAAILAVIAHDLDETLAASPPPDGTPADAPAGTDSSVDPTHGKAPSTRDPSSTRDAERRAAGGKHNRRTRRTSSADGRGRGTTPAAGEGRSLGFAVTYPPELPISERRDDLLATIRDHQVVIVAGETGSGKSTQLPKLCLELGRGRHGLIGHTQPRRIAARSIAERVADELGQAARRAAVDAAMQPVGADAADTATTGPDAAEPTTGELDAAVGAAGRAHAAETGTDAPAAAEAHVATDEQATTGPTAAQVDHAGKVGGVVGYAVRFTDEVGPDTMVKLMTDGILLAEIQRDRRLSRYDTIIIDEAHERSLNIDFLLGYLRRLLPERPDLKVIITSATIDTERFSTHFADAPIVTVSGRTYPVEVRYRPLVDPDDPDRAIDQTDGICNAVTELVDDLDGDILVFCSGEREIRDAADALRDLAKTDRRLSGTDVLPLYARLSAAEQHRVFSSHTGRRIVVATNVAETSLTVPGIRSVIDPGTARISRYSRRTKVQRLPIEDISQASANQRSGRCGRLGPGIAIRLYAEDDFSERPAFTEPEIQRTNLASVILQMAALGLGDVEAFPFVDPPDRRSIRDGVALLEELGAIDARNPIGTKRWLTPIGRKLARLPIDPRLGRMLLAAADEGCLREMQIIVAAMSIQDPRDRPTEHREQADQLHARFRDPDSDFLSYLHLWEYLQTERRAGSSSRFRRLCRNEFIHYLRVREWQDLHTQLQRVSKDLGLARNREPAHPDAIHRALLTGLLSHIGLKDRDTGEYRGARNVRFMIARGSTFSKRAPNWVMAGELVETNRLWARVIAPVRPEWIEQLGDHLISRTYSDPWWDPDRGAAMAHESASIFGISLAANRAVQYARIDPDYSRELFIRHALVGGEWQTHHDFIARNREAIDEVHALEARLRRGDLLIGDDDIVDWFHHRLPDNITDVRRFDRWWKKARAATPDLLTMTVDDLLAHDADELDDSGFPEVWHHAGMDLPVVYELDPTSHLDGMNVDVPLGALNRIDPAPFEWLVPGLRRELVTELIKTLPKHLRKQFAPVPETVDAVIDRLDPDGGRLIEQLRRELARHKSVVVPTDAFAVERIPAHLRPTFRVVDGRGVIIADGHDIGALRALLAEDLRDSLAASTHGIERTGCTEWDFGELPRVVETDAPGHVIRAYPALVDEGETVGVALFATAAEQADAMWLGTRRLLLLHRPSVSKQLRAVLTDDVKLALVTSPYASPSAWFDDCLDAAIDAIMIDADAPAWNAVAFDRLRTTMRDRLPRVVTDLAKGSAAILAERRSIEVALYDLTAPAFAEASTDMASQLASLTYPGFVAGVGAERLADVRRYLWGIERRIEALPDRVGKDRELMEKCRILEAAWDRAVETHGLTAELEDAAWMLQELRISYFAQSLGTKGTVSEKRIRSLLG